MLQDMRHLFILDFRDTVDFSETHIRRSLNVTIENYKEALMTLFAMKDKDHNSHYEADDLKRILYVLP